MYQIIILISFYVIIATLVGFLVVKSINKNNSIEYTDNNIFLFPFIGFSIIVSIMEIFGVFWGAKFTTIILISLILISTIKIGFQDYLWHFKQHYLLSLIIIVSLAVSLFPSFYVGFPTSFTTINNDLIFYLSIPEWLNEHSYFVHPVLNSYRPFFSIADLHLTRFSRVGADYFNTVSMNVLGLDSIKTFNGISSFFLLLMIIGVYFTCHFCFNFEKKITYVITLIIALNSFLFWIFALQYMPQLAGNAFYIFCIGITYKTIQEPKNKLMLLSGISIAGLISVYSEYAVYLLLPLCGYLIIYLFRNQEIFLKKSKTVLCFLCISILVNPVGFYFAIKYNVFAFTSTQNLAGIVQYIPISNQLLMLMGLKLLDYGEPSYLLKFLSIGIFLVMLYGFFKLKREIKIFLTPLYCFIFTMLFYLTFINKFPYGYYKTLMFSQIFFIILFVLGLFEIARKFILCSNLRKGVLVFLIISLLLANTRNIYDLEKSIIQSGLANESYMELKDAKQLIPVNEKVYATGFNMADQHYISYFFRDRDVILQNTSSYFPNSKLPEEPVKYILSNHNDIIKYPGTIVWNNPKFTLYKSDTREEVINIGDGWNQMELWNSTPTRWTTSKAQLSIFGKNTDGSIKLRFDAYLPPNVGERTLLILCNGIKVDELKVSNKISYQTNNIKLMQNQENLIEFVLKEGAVKAASDPRQLGIAIQNLEITH